MKGLSLLIFLVLLSCNTVKKEYVCDGRPCVDKKEFNDFFSKNLSVEIFIPDNNKNNNIDLAKLNTGTSNSKKIDKKSERNKKRARFNEKKEKQKAEKIKLKQERKAKKKQKKIIKIEEKNLAKLEKNNIKSKKKNEIITNKEKSINSSDQIIVKKVVPNKSNVYKEPNVNLIKTKNIKNICDEIKDCDIDKIAEILTEKGKTKPFPNISSN